MSDKAQAARRKFNKALNALNRISGLNTSFVITEANKTFDGSLVDNERMYISADAFENDTWAETVVHEYTHLEEGSEEYAKMVDFLKSDDILVEVEIDGEVKRIPLWQKAQAAVLGKDYGFDENKIKVISEKVNAQMALTPEEVKLYREFMTEVAAHETQYLLGTEAFIDKIVASDRSLARKLVDKILNLKEAFSKVVDKATRGQLKMLRQAEKLYLDAARKAGDMRLVRYILSRSPETEGEVDSDAQIVYNNKYKKNRTYYSQYNTTAMQWAFSSNTKPGDIKVLYNPQDNTWNKLVADDTEERYGTLLSIKDTPENAEAIRNLHDEVYNENHGEEQRDSESVRKDYERYWSLSNNIGDDNFDVEEQDTNGRSREVHGGESEGDRSGDSQKGNGNKRLKYSLKIGDENLTVDGEERKNLVALHNLSEEKLMKVLELGGFPMPSIAITRADLGHEQFGDITVIFGRETIDPKVDSRNKVYSRDGYTPTVPKIDYKVNDKVLSKISKK